MKRKKKNPAFGYLLAIVGMVFIIDGVVLYTFGQRPSEFVAIGIQWVIDSAGQVFHSMGL